MSDQPQTKEPTELFCYVHPQTPTTLRCSRCERPICAKCAVLTPTGYRCKECVRGQQKVFNTARWYDYPLAFAIAAGLAYVGSRFVPAMGFFTIFVAPIIGVIIAEAIRFITGRRRSKRLYQLTAVGAGLGSLPLLLLMLLGLGGGGFGFLFSLLWQALYAFTVVTTIFTRLAGIQIR